MKKYLSAVVLALVVTATFAVAQMPTTAVIANVPFAFLVSGKSFPAGTYEFSANSSLSEITVTNTKGKEAALASVITRLSPKSDNEAAVVFDVAGTDHNLAEVYVPGIDGFQVQGAPANHTHFSVKGKKK